MNHKIEISENELILLKALLRNYIELDIATSTLLELEREDFEAQARATYQKITSTQFLNNRKLN